MKPIKELLQQSEVFMLHITSLLTMLFVIISGLTMIALGDWRKCPWRYAALALSTMSTVALLFTQFYFKNSINMEYRVYFGYQIDCILRNAALIIFNIVVGYEKIPFRNYGGFPFRNVHNIKKL